MSRIDFRADRSGRTAGGQMSMLQRLFARSSLYAALASTLVNQKGGGSVTLARGGAKTIIGYAPAALPGDPMVELTLAINEAGFAGARRVSAGAWSEVFADGTPIPASNLKGASVETASQNTLVSTGFALDGLASAVPSTFYSSDGQLMTLLTQGLAAGFGQQYYQPVAMTLSRTASVEVKKGTALFVGLNQTGNAATSVSFDLTLGTASLAGIDVSGYGISLLPNGNWYIYVSNVITSASFWALKVGDTAVEAQAGTPIAGAGKTVHIGRMQSEPLPYMSSHIPLSTAAVARIADTLTESTVGKLNSTEGAIAFTFTSDHNAPISSVLMSAIVDASNGLLVSYYAGVLYFEKRAPVGTIASTATTTYYKDIPIKVAFTWGAGGLAIYQNGAKIGFVATSTAVVLPTFVELGSLGGSSQIGGFFKDLRFWQTAPTDAEMIKETTL